MYSVTKRVEMIKQPCGGYLKTGMFVREDYNDGIVLNGNENIDPSIVGLAVDYLTRYLSGLSAEEAFRISLLGATRLDIYRGTKQEKKKALELIKKVDGMSDESIISACMLAGYDVCFRASCDDYRQNGLIPDEYSISNIRNMVERSCNFFLNEGEITKTNITFEGGYTDIISSGDADYLTPNGLWDMKVSKHDITADYTLQLLVYYLMGLKSDPDTFKSISKLGFFNPRKNISYWTDVSFIPQSVISIVKREIIGYMDD